MSEYTKEEIKLFEAVCFLKCVKEGDVVTARTIDALRTLNGGLFDKLGEPRELILGKDFTIETPND
jgi:hypothetical protein